MRGVPDRIVGPLRLGIFPVVDGQVAVAIHGAAEDDAPVRDLEPLLHRREERLQPIDDFRRELRWIGPRDGNVIDREERLLIDRPASSSSSNSFAIVRAASCERLISGPAACSSSSSRLCSASSKAPFWSTKEQWTPRELRATTVALTLGRSSIRSDRREPSSADGCCEALSRTPPRPRSTVQVFQVPRVSLAMTGSSTGKRMDRRRLPNSVWRTTVTNLRPRSEI